MASRSVRTSTTSGAPPNGLTMSIGLRADMLSFDRARSTPRRSIPSSVGGRAIFPAALRALVAAIGFALGTRHHDGLTRVRGGAGLFAGVLRSAGFARRCDSTVSGSRTLSAMHRRPAPKVVPGFDPDADFQPNACANGAAVRRRRGRPRRSSSCGWPKRSGCRWRSTASSHGTCSPRRRRSLHRTARTSLLANMNLRGSAGRRSTRTRHVRHARAKRSAPSPRGRDVSRSDRPSQSVAKLLMVAHGAADQTFLESRRGTAWLHTFGDA